MTDPKITVARVPVAIIRFHPRNVRRDLGDLRGLADSIARYGVMQPIVVERMGQQLRLRAGHRRVAASKLAGVKHIPAVVHGEPLDDADWIMQALHENTFREGLTDQERREAIEDLLAAGCTQAGIAEGLSVSVSTVKRWLADPEPKPAGSPAPRRVTLNGPTLRARLGQLADTWQDRADAGLNPLEARTLLVQLRDLAATGRLPAQGENAGAA